MVVVWYRYIVIRSIYFDEGNQCILNYFNHIGSVMVSELTSFVVDLGFELRSGQTKDYEIVISFFSAKHAVLNSENKDWVTRKSD